MQDGGHKLESANGLRWNPAQPIEVTPEAYEKQVVAWLSSAGAELPKFSVDHLRRVPGNGGEYSIDGWVEFEIFDGAKFSVLVECKRHRRPIERDVVLSVHAKAQAVGAQKSIIFSTTGFQSGAVEFASSVGIALVVFVNGQLTYETRSTERLSERNYPPDLPQFAGRLVRIYEGSTAVSLVTDDHISALVDWLVSGCGNA